MGGGRGGKSKSKSKSKNKGKTKKLSGRERAQQMARNRIGTGTPKNPNRSISSIRASQQKSIRDKAAARHEKFKQTRVQTFGGKRSDDSYSAAEKKRIEDANYSVQGYSKAPPISKPKFKQADSNLIAGEYTSSYSQKNWGLRPDGIHGPYKVGDVFGPGGVSNPLFRFTGTGWERVKAQADTPDTSDTSGMVASTNLSGLGISPKVSDYDPGSTAFALKTGNYDPAAYQSFKKSGLNLKEYTNKSDKEGGKTARTLSARWNKPGWDTLAGGLDFATNDRFDFDNYGKGLFGLGAVTPSNVINDAMSIAQNKNLTVNDMGTFLNTVKDITTSDDKLGTVKNIISNQDTTGRLLGPVYDQLRNSEIVDSLATKHLKLPSNYGEQLDATKGALDTAYNNLGTDNKANRRIISDLFIGKDKNLNLLKRAAEQFTNDSGTVANYDTKTNLAKFQDSFKENSPLFRGLNRDERGLIGGLGNWRLSNLGTNIVGQNLEGTNNVADLASNIIDTAGTNRATKSFLRTIKSGAPTPRSLIKGVVGGGGGNNRSNNYRPSGTARTLRNVATAEQPVEELLPILPQTQLPNLQGIQNQAYNNQMSVYGMNPNYLAQIIQPSYNRPRQNFRSLFNRGFMPKLLNQSA